jgi:hypothetical protein
LESLGIAGLLVFVGCFPGLIVSWRILVITGLPQLSWVSPSQESGEGQGGYAKESSDAFKRVQQETFRTEHFMVISS